MSKIWSLFFKIPQSGWGNTPYQITIQIGKWGKSVMPTEYRNGITDSLEET